MTIEEIIELVKQQEFAKASSAMADYGLFKPIDSYGNTFIHYACTYEVPGLFDKVTEYNEALDAPGTCSMTPLMLACLFKNVDAAQRLIELGANVNATDINGLSPMFFAVGFSSLPSNSFSIGDDSPCYIKPQENNEREENRESFKYYLYEKYDLADREITSEFLAKLKETNGFRSTDETSRLKLVTMLLEAGISPSNGSAHNSFNGDVLCEISAAIKNGNTQCAELLIQNGYDLNACDGIGIPPLCQAARSLDYGMTKTLLDAGASRDVKDSWGQTPIALAQYREMRDIVELLAKSSDSLSQDNLALIRAAQVGDISSIRLFVDKGSNINQRDHQGNTPLIWAAANLKLAAVKALIELGADVNATNNGGITALHDVVDRLNTESLEKLPIVRCLIENGANINAMSDIQGTPINIAIITRDSKIAHYLALNGGSLNHHFARIANTDLEWHAIWCILNDLPDILVELTSFCSQGLKNPLDDEFGDFAGQTLLSVAVSEGKRECAIKLIEDCHVDIDIPDAKTGFTPLMVAAIFGNFALADMLLRKGANLYLQTPEGYSVVDCAYAYYQAEGDKSALAWINRHCF